MTIRALTEPCWTAETGEGRHWPDEDQARDDADAATDPDATPVQLGSCCLIAECDGCGEQFGDDEWTVVHFTPASSGNAESLLSSYEWTITPDGKVYCDCEPEWDDADSNAYQDRVEAGLEPEDSDG